MLCCSYQRCKLIVRDVECLIYSSMEFHVNVLKRRTKFVNVSPTLRNFGYIKKNQRMPNSAIWEKTIQSRKLVWDYSTYDAWRSFNVRSTQWPKKEKVNISKLACHAYMCTQLCNSILTSFWTSLDKLNNYFSEGFDVVLNLPRWKQLYPRSRFF